MSKAPSAETQLRSAKKELKRVVDERNAAIAQREVYRARATKAEQEVAEWKRRFDTLLAREQLPTDREVGQ